MSTVRCFVAADFPEDVRRDLGALQQRLKARGLDLRWVSPAALHLTLKFLGELPAETFEAAASALEAPLGLGAPLVLKPADLGAFPSPRRPRVLWVGLAGDVPRLARAALVLEARLEPLGIPRETRPFTPHLTLARARGPAGGPPLDRYLADEGEYGGPEFEVSDVTLYESRLGPGGPRYLPRRTISLL